jgi:glycosyltransferase involved in cell wall biosynthesis
MTTSFANPRTDDISVADSAVSGPTAEIEVALLTGGFDKPYAFGVAMAVMPQAVRLDFIGSDEVDSPELHAQPRLNFLNLRGSLEPDASLASKVSRVLLYYARLIRYATFARPRIFHILWNNRLQYFDRTLLTLYYKALGKKIVLTAHNVNAGKRDENDSLLNRLTLKIQYRLADHIFVHTEKMKRELLDDFGVREHAVSVIPFGINNSVPNTALTATEARRRLGIREREQIILFFGAIRPYKGLEYLVAAFQQIAPGNRNYRLIIAGERKGGAETYLAEIQQTISQSVSREQIVQKIEYIPDEETELYFKAADILVLPYTHVFQSGVLFLGYSFGLPVIATDVGSLADDIVEGRTGFLCKPCDSESLAKAIETYFGSQLYQQLDSRRPEISNFANQRYSWDVVSRKTRAVYDQLLAR